MILKQLSFLIAVLSVQHVVSEAEDEIKRGTYPFMAFIYYPDDTVIDKKGDRITRAGILVKLDWLITSSLDTVEPMAFPQKTLMARLGSIAIDKQFNINEDEDEQEREIIQIIRPHNFSAVEWWYSDISLLKTLFPFNITSSVAITSISPKPEFENKDCFILVFAKKKSNTTMDRFLMQIPVDVVQSTAESCGNYFKQNTMTCALDMDDKKNVSYSSDYCQGNSGGPLICNNDVYGLQTYSEGCEEPHLYQIFSGWADFISCSIQDICQEKKCAQVCTLINKDTEKYVTKSIPTTAAERVYKEETTPLLVTKLFESEESNNVAEESSSDRPTATTIKEYEVTTSTQSIPLSSSENALNTSSSDMVATNEDSDNSRRSNVEAQQQPVKKPRSSAAIAIPLSMFTLVILWSTIHVI